MPCPVCGQDNVAHYRLVEMWVAHAKHRKSPRHLAAVVATDTTARARPADNSAAEADPVESE